MQGSSPSGTKQRIYVGLERRHHSLRTNQHSALLTAFLHKLLPVLWVSAQVWLPLLAASSGPSALCGFPENLASTSEEHKPTCRKALSLYVCPLTWL